MRFRVIGALLLALAGLLPAAPAAAAPTTCGGSWSGASIHDCVFRYSGLPLTVNGKATAELGAGATVVVWLEVVRQQPAALPGIPILACAAVRMSGTNCTQSAGSGNLLRELPLGAMLRCRVAGLNFGTYSCLSGPA